MFYLIAIPIAALLYHSMYTLMKKYIGQEPTWLKFYAVFCFIYIVAIPTFFINYLSQLFGISNGVNALLMGITATAIILLAIKFTPKIEKSVREWD